MRRNIYKLLLLVNICFLISIFSIKNTNNNVYSIKNKYNSYNINNKLSDKILIIEKINLKEKIEKANNDFSNLENNIVYYNDFNINNKIVIFGHSGRNQIFDNLDKLNIGDESYIYDENKCYKYVITKIFIISKYDVDILNQEKNSSKILLITCNKKNKSKRLVVEMILYS